MENLGIVYQPESDVLKARDAMMAFTVTRFYLDYSHKDIERIIVAEPRIPWQHVDKDKRIFLEGFTPTLEEFARLLDEAGDVVWLDNDMDAVEAMHAASTADRKFKRVKGIRRGESSMGDAAWDSYLSWSNNKPELIKLLDAYIMNRREPEWEDKILPFYKGLYATSRDPMDEECFEGFWKKIICFRRDKVYEKETIDRIISEGKSLL